MPDREIGLPFKLDSQGRIGTVSDPSRVGRQHLLTYLLTRPGERVMRSTFGTPLKDFITENLDPLQVTLLAQRVQEKVGADVRGVRLVSVTAAEDYDDAALKLTVEFALAVGAGEGTLQTTELTLGGTA